MVASNILVQNTPNNNSENHLVVVNDAGAEISTKKKTVSPKQQKRLEDQKAREIQKALKRKEKAAVRDRKADEKFRRDVARENQAEEIRREKHSNKTQTVRKLEEAKRLAEERVLFEQEFNTTTEHPSTTNKVVVNHTKKSILTSNRLGGKHMA